MISISGSEQLQKQLEEFSVTFKRKLENMVEEFAVEVAKTASNQTPIGNETDLMKGSGSYWNYYKTRRDNFGLPIEVGYHKGAWGFSNTSNFSFQQKIESVMNMLNDVRNDAESVVLGRDFYIGAKGPGFYSLEHGSSAQAPDGIMAPTLAMIMQAQKADLQRFYDNG